MTKFVKKYTKDQLIYLPRFDVTMAAHFFDLTPGALKQRERAGQFIDQKGIEIQPVRMPGGSRRYSIDDLREMAHSLRRASRISTPQFNVIINRLDAFSTPVKVSAGKKRSIYSD